MASGDRVWVQAKGQNGVRYVKRQRAVAELVTKILGAEMQGRPLPNQIQPREHSKGGGKDAIPHERVGSSWVNPDGNRNVPYLYEDGDGRKLNLNWDNPENRWNEDDLFLVVRNSLHDGERCLRQPPSIFPVSARGSANAAYRL